MSSGMTGQTPCLTSRWDKPAQTKQRDVRQQGSVGNATHPVSSAGAFTPAVSTPTDCTSQLPTLSSAPQSLMTEGDKSAPQGGVEMAAAMAAKINNMLMAKGRMLTPPPLLAKTPPFVSMSTNTAETVVTEVDINDVPINCRNLLTKGKTQEEIRQCSGAVVSTKGHYVVEALKGKAVERPLYLHVQGKSQDQVNKAVMRIKEIISEDVMKTAALSGGHQVPIIPPLTLYPKLPRPVGPTSMPWMHNSTTHGHRPSAPHSGSFVHTKIFVGMEQALPSFNVNEKVGGPMGTYLGHIQTETGARVFLRGKGSGYIEQASRRESFEPLYVYVSHPNAAGLESAKKLTESLLETVKADHACVLSTYTATSCTQSYAAHGFPPNSNYSNQGSWYNYPANGYAGGYSAYPGAGGYWSNANGPPSHSNLSTTPQSSQAMVQYPVCPRKPHPYLVQEDPGSSATVEPEGSPTREDAGSPKRRFQEEPVDDEFTSSSSEAPAKEASSPPASSVAEEKGVERFLMPPPPPVAHAVRKRQRETGPVPQRPASQPAHPTPAGLQEDVCDKKCKVAEDKSGLVPYRVAEDTSGLVTYGVAEDTSGLVPYGVAEDSSGLVPYGVAKDSSGLVPYGGDSSDEEEERTRSSKTAHS